MSTMLHQPQPAQSSRDPDNWYGVQDKKERKKIQDRLAQRQRRKRLAEMKQSRAAAEVQDQSSQAPSTHDLYSSAYDQSSWASDGYMLNQPYSSNGSINPLDLFVGASQPSYTASSYSSSLGSANPLSQYTVKAAETFQSMMSSVSSSPSASRGQTPPCVTAFAAMYSNAVVLQLSCDKAHVPMKSSARDTTPQPLKPTSLQLSVPHLQYIDTLPFATLRQNLIALHGLFDEEAFCSDLMNPASVSVIGNESWDPAAWKISEDFMKRWSYLFLQNYG